MMDQGCAARKAVERATGALASGNPVLVVSGTGDQVVADALIAAVHATPHWTAWLVRVTSGLLCAALPGRRADQLDLPAMVRNDEDDDVSASFAVAVDAAHGVGTGISATDRARTARVLASASSRPEDLVRPGHLLPVRTARWGVLEHPGSAEAGVDLCGIAGLPPVGLTAAVLADDGDLLRGHEVDAFAHANGLPVVHVDDVVHYCLYHGGVRGDRIRQTLSRVVEAPARAIRAVDFEDRLTGGRHTVYIGVATPDASPKVYVLNECPHRDPLLAFDCQCQLTFDKCRECITTDGGVIVYLRAEPPSAPKFAVREAELMQGRIISMLTQLGFAAVTLPKWASGDDLAATCDLMVASPCVTREPRQLVTALL